MTTLLRFVPALRCLMMSAVMIISRASAPPPPAATPISLDRHSSPSNENAAHSVFVGLLSKTKNTSLFFIEFRETEI